MVMATIKPTRMGCITATPACAPSTPVTTGKKDPPVCANTKTKDMAVALMSAGKSLVPTEMA